MVGQGGDCLSAAGVTWAGEQRNWEQKAGLAIAVGWGTGSTEVW